MGLTVRATLPRDVSAINTLVKQTLKVEAKTTLLLAGSLLNLTAHDDRETVVGFMCLDDVPCMRMGSQDPEAQQWLEKAAKNSHTLGSSAFVRVCAAAHLFEIEAASVLLKAAFLQAPSLQRLFMATAGDLSFTEPGLAAVFTRVSSDKATGLVLYEATRQSVVPPLDVRSARVEDHDDMLPILQRCERTFPALAKLPDSSRPDEPFALTRVVAGQDERNRVLVAESNGKLVGFILVTSDVDTSSLAETFPLHPYDNFLPSEVYEEQFATAKESVRAQKMEVLRAQMPPRSRGARAEAGAADGVAEATQTDPEAEGADGGAGPRAEGEEGGAGEDGEGGEQAGKERPGTAGSAAAEEEALAAAAEPTEEEIRAEMLAMFAGQNAAGVEPTLFAITMLCMDPHYEEQAHEFLRPAFDAFPDKLYCVVTLPHDSRVPPLMDTMTRVAPMPGSLFPEVLYMLNRHALLPHFEVRLGAASDAELVGALVDGMPNSSDILTSFQGAADAGTAVVAVVQGELVGLVTVNPEVDLELLQANFALSNHVDLAYQPRQQHGEIDMYTMNPIFVHRHRAFLTSAMRLLGKTALYYALPPGQQPPDMQEVLEQVAPRHRGGDKQQLTAEFALYVFTRQHAFKQRQTINSQIVIAGSSECGLAVLERLLLDPDLQFNYLTLLAPGGIKVGGMACQYTAGVIARLGLEVRVLLLDAEMVGLDRAARVIELSDGSQLGYNQLVVSAGLQDQSRYRFADADPEVAGLLVTDLELAADFTMNDAMVMNQILVYGNALGAYHSMSVLEAKGAGAKARFVAPPGQEPPVVSLMHALAAEAGVAVPRPEEREVESLIVGQPGATELHATATLVDPADPGPREELQVDLLVGCEPPGVGQALFACLNDASIVFDGRVVVDHAFRTNDPNIFAAGTVAKLSRRFGGVHLEHYNSRDVGQRLASSLVEHFLLAGRPVSPAVVPAAPPLHRARAVGCMLPGGLYFVYAGCPRAMQAPSLQPPQGGRELCTRTERGLTRVNLDADGCVHSLMYLGRVPVSAPRLGALVGLHSNYLNQLLPRLQEGDVSDLLTHLTDTWSELLVSDAFPEFRQQLLDMALASVAVGGRDVEGGLVEMVTHAQDATLEFVRAHAGELPGFEVPQAAKV